MGNESVSKNDLHRGNNKIDLADVTIFSYLFILERGVDLNLN